MIGAREEFACIFMAEYLIISVVFDVEDRTGPCLDPAMFPEKRPGMALHACVGANPNCVFVAYRWSTNAQKVVIGDDRYVAKL